MNKKETAQLLWLGTSVGAASMAVTSLVKSYHEGTLYIPGISDPLPPHIQVPETTTQKIAFQTESPSHEILQSVIQSIITAEFGIKPGYEQYGFLGFGCAGSIIRDGNNTPYILTARHCLKDTLTAADGTEYLSQDEAGNSIIETAAKDLSGNKFSTTPNNWYLNQSPTGNADGLILQFESPNSISAPGIEFSTDEPLFPGQRLTMLSPEGGNGEVRVIPLYYIGNNSDGSLSLISFPHEGMEKYGCIPGTSGSAIINNEGKLEGVMSSHYPPMIVTSHIADVYKLDKNLIGENIQLCNAVSMESIRGLMRNP